MNKSKEEAAIEIEDIFNEAKRALVSLHHQKMKLITKFKEAVDADAATDILNKLKALQ